MCTRIFAAGAVAALALAGATMPASAADGDASLSVLHGVPGMTVDVYVNGDLTLDDFEPGDLAGPLERPAGTYTVAIQPPTLRTTPSRPLAPSTSTSKPTWTTQQSPT